MEGKETVSLLFAPSGRGWGMMTSLKRWVKLLEFQESDDVQKRVRMASDLSRSFKGLLEAAG